ncbi:MAG: methyltransferase domain-containing protein [Roseiflexaceae bacterium]
MSHTYPSAVQSIDALATAIDPWLQHMTWRRDFQTWRERRLYQEQYQAERIAQIEQFVGSLHGLRVLDLGAGMGGFAVAATLHGATVTVSEYNYPYCEIVQLRAERYALQIPIVNAAGEQLPFADAQFDVVVCWDVLEHVQNPSYVLQEIYRVLTPRGRVLLTAINRRAWIDPHYHIPSINWWPRALAEWYISQRGRSKANTRFNDMQRLSAMHYFDYPAFVALATRIGYSTVDMNEVALRNGNFVSKKQSRQHIRALLRRLGLEHLAYRMQRAWYVGMFELALTKEA